MQKSVIILNTFFTACSNPTMVKNKSNVMIENKKCNKMNSNFWKLIKCSNFKIIDNNGGIIKGIIRINDSFDFLLNKKNIENKLAKIDK